MDASDKYIGVMLDNRYEILEKIGTGGMAVVYKARCHRLNRLVAVKILKEELAEDEEFRRRFHTESQAVAMLQHPNIVAVYDVSKTSAVDYIVMELIEGITLKQYINRKGLLGWKESLHFAMQIAKAISHAHSKGIIHRDIKPHNIMILKDGSIKVADFGIARLISTQNTLTQESLGSVHYISPEQAKGGHVDARTDIYSLGVVMYEMLTSHLPFVGDSAVSVAIQHISAIPLLPREINPEIPQGLEDITMHAMEPKLNLRYATAEELLRDLEEFRKNPAATFRYSTPAVDTSFDGDSTRPVPDSGAISDADDAPKPVRRSPERVSAPRRPEMSRDEYRSSHRRSSRTAMMIGVAAVLVILVAAFLFMWQYILKDMLDPEIDYVLVPDFVGLAYSDIIANPDFRGNYTFERSEKSNYSEKYEEGVVYEQTPKAEHKETLGESKILVTLFVSLGKRPAPQMPNLVNQDYRTAHNAISEINADTELNLQLEVVLESRHDDDYTRDLVIETVPKAGVPLLRGMIVYITYSEGPEIKLIEVPNVVGMSLSSARLELESRNLTVGLPEYIDSDTPKDTVVFQTKRGEMVEAHTEIMLQVSNGPPPSPSPEPETPTPPATPPDDPWETPPEDPAATPVENPEDAPVEGA